VPLVIDRVGLLSRDRGKREFNAFAGLLFGSISINSAVPRLCWLLRVRKTVIFSETKAKMGESDGRHANAERASIQL